MKTLKSLILMSLIALFLYACGSGGGGATNPNNQGSSATDTTSPTVSQTSPANGTTGVAVNSAISVTFSEAVDSSSVTTSTFQVAGLAGTVFLNGTTATFTPSSNLSNNTTYTVTLTTGIKDAAGNTMATDYTWTFTTGTGAIFKIPDTGQTTSYTNTFGEDHDYTINPPSSTDNGNGTITDNVTGLIWQKQDDGATKNWDDAVTYCSNLTLGNQTDWRLPARIELISIVDYGTYMPAINTTYFPGTISNDYWSSTALASGTSNAWLVNFSIADMGYPSTTSSAYVRCVQGGQATPSLTDNGNGTVRDNRTLLTWQQGENSAMTWEAALSYCEGLSLAGQTDWRLPNIKELSSLVDDTRSGPAINTTFFPNTPYSSSEYWSSTTYPSNSSYAWNVSFYYGYHYSYNKTDAKYVRCVRGQVSAPDVTPPTVTSTNPTGNASGVAINTAITATFSETMDSSTVTTSTFTLKQGATPIAGAVAYSGTTATFTPSFNLSYSTTYTATITTGAKDAAGNAVAANYTWSFTTGNAADTTAPTNTTASNFINSGASSTSSTSVTLAVSATDAVGVTAYFASESSTAPSASASGWTAITSTISYSASVSFTLSNGGGTKTVYVWFKDSAGNVSSSASDTIALTVQKSWGTPQLLETITNVVGASDPQIAFDSSGNAIAVWDQVVGTSNSIYTNRYTTGVGWGTAQVISSGVSASWPKIAIDSSGNAIAVWRQWDGTYLDIYANRYTAGSGWGTAQLIESSTGNADSDCPPGVAIDSSGNAIAVWSQFNGTYSSIYANRYTAGSGWGTAQLIENNTYNAGAPEVAMDSSGNAIAVWDQWDGTVRNIYTNRYTAGTGWGTAQLLETNAGGAMFPQVAFDSSGNAIAVWYQSDGTYYNIYANRYTAGGGWGLPQLIESNTGNASQPQIGIDSSGNAMAVWSQSDGTYGNLYANRYTAGTGWGTAQFIENNTGSAGGPQIAFDPSGNAIAVWSQSDASGAGDIYANHYE